MTENTINPITTLEFNGEEVEAKATFLFDKTAKKFAKDEQDENGKTTKVSGFNAIYNGILERDPIAIADFWECATAYLGKNAPKREDIEQTLMKIIDEKEDSIELLQGALQVLNHSGFFKQKSRLFWTQMNSAPSMVKEEEKESTKNGIEFMKNNYKEIMGELPY
ncbi:MULTISPECIES: tail assembly chaperone [Staphylococcus]|jgi:hypothetical protein|uniref:tail assembly chaperone n=1 Tax=Staphylococcus TaxID=1279 RepID=UPI0005FBFB3A|nr:MULTISPECIES: tail assembly chaperone [Staphylococcus]KAB2161288.1 hypothetical protein F9B20_04000 [Staphylococcus epidermidis]KAB2237257.1 hypothetical protein F9B27_02020 [Staphylococcus epidermidis]KAB2246673.1 hypothetical protein F9B49_02200 [Staphylococcus epidermidis]KAB2249505.1 hypothetical protein F9B29_01325 [Staphylococcus epidermidis]KAB2256744.1 hypothetical protein F9B51_01325 [Staphylococcus epidermidis]